MSNETEKSEASITTTRLEVESFWLMYKNLLLAHLPSFDSFNVFRNFVHRNLRDNFKGTKSPKCLVQKILNNTALIWIHWIEIFHPQSRPEQLCRKHQIASKSSREIINFVQLDCLSGPLCNEKERYTWFWDKLQPVKLLSFFEVQDRGKYWRLQRLEKFNVWYFKIERSLILLRNVFGIKVLRI